MAARIKYRRYALLQVEIIEDSSHNLPHNTNLDSTETRNRVEIAIQEGDYKIVALTPIETWVLDKWIQMSEG